MYCNDKGIDCENANWHGSCMVTACTKPISGYYIDNGSSKIQISNSNIKPYYDNFSLIEWRTDFTHLPVETNLLVIAKDETGDRAYYYTTLAWVVNNPPGEKVIWIADNEQIFDEVIMWAMLPKYEDIKRFG